MQNKASGAEEQDKINQIEVPKELTMLVTNSLLVMQHHHIQKKQKFQLTYQVVLEVKQSLMM